MRHIILAAFGLWLIANCQSAVRPHVSRIVIAGDSTAADYPPERINQIGWGQALPYYLTDDISVLNLAVNGRSTKSYINEGRWTELVDQLHPGDLVLISFGHNDSRDDSPERHAPAMGAYKRNLERFVSDVQAAGARVAIVSPAARRLWEGPVMVETHGVYRVAAEQAAAESGAAFIDLSNLSLAYFEGIGREETKVDYVWLTRPHWQTGEPEILEDNTHFSFVGACGVANLIAIELGSRALARPRHTEIPSEDGGRPNTVLACAEAIQQKSDAAATAALSGELAN